MLQHHGIPTSASWRLLAGNLGRQIHKLQPVPADVGWRSVFVTSIISSQEWIRLIEAVTWEAPAVIADAINWQLAAGDGNKQGSR